MVNFLRDVMIAVAILATLVALIVYPYQESTPHPGAQSMTTHAQTTPAATSNIGGVSTASFGQRRP